MVFQLGKFGVKFVEQTGVIIIPDMTVNDVLEKDAHWLLFALSSVGENAREQLNNSFNNIPSLRQRVRASIVDHVHDGAQVHFRDARDGYAVAAILYESVASTAPALSRPIPRRAQSCSDDGLGHLDWGRF
jgi:hypothetical protein